MCVRKKNLSCGTKSLEKKTEYNGRATGKDHQDLFGHFDTCKHETFMQKYMCLRKYQGKKTLVYFVAM